jgi:hypothetical protein
MFILTLRVFIFTVALPADFCPPILFYWTIISYTVQKEQGVRLISLMQREIILYTASDICVSSYLADFYLLSKFVSME